MFLSRGYGGYLYLYYNDPITGKRTKRSTRTRVKAEAYRFLQTFKANERAEANEKINPTIETLRQDIEKYILTSLSETTKYFYRCVFKKLKDLYTNVPLRMLGYREMEYYKNERAKEVSQTTVNIELRTIKTILNYALKLEYIPVNPAKQVKQFKIPQKERRFFKEDEIRKLLQFIDNPTIRGIFLIGILTGCRLDEIINLQWKDVNFNQKLIHIRNKDNFVTKSRKLRVIPISDSLLNLLLEMQPNLQNPNVIDFYNTDLYLFHNKQCNHYSKNYISHKFKYYLRKAKLPEDLNFHSTRHTALSLMAKNGVPIFHIKEIAGHSNIETTMVYLHSEIEDLRKAVSKISF